jgi:hypothetical protein
MPRPDRSSAPVRPRARAAARAAGRAASPAGAAQRPPPLLDAGHAAFVTGGVSIIAASTDAANVPSVERAIGCKVSADRRRVTIFVAASSARALVADIRRAGRVAVVFSDPPTHRALQLKGTDAEVVRVQPADHRVVAAYRAAFAAAIGSIGHPPELARAALACPPDEVVAIAFTPAAAFVQTPGPRAGAPVAA